MNTFQVRMATLLFDGDKSLWLAFQQGPVCLNGNKYHRYFTGSNKRLSKSWYVKNIWYLNYWDDGRVLIFHLPLIHFTLERRLFDSNFWIFTFCFSHFNHFLEICLRTPKSSITWNKQVQTFWHNSNVSFKFLLKFGWSTAKGLYQYEKWKISPLYRTHLDAYQLWEHNHSMMESLIIEMIWAKIISLMRSSQSSTKGS